MTAGPYSLSALYPEDRFRILAGATVMGGLKGETRHHFCGSCLSWIFTQPSGLDAMVNIRTPMFDDAKHFVPFVELYLDEGLPGASGGAPHAFGKAPDADAFLALANDFAIWERRPD